MITRGFTVESRFTTKTESDENKIHSTTHRMVSNHLRVHQKNIIIHMWRI